MLVMKFGGSSVADGAQIRKVFDIVSRRSARHPFVVSSAHKGVTDLLISAARQAAAGTPDADPIIERHRRVLAELDADRHLLDPFFRELEELLRGISLVREASPRVLDYVQSFGERMSVRVIAQAFTSWGVKSMAFDAWDLGFVTDEAFGAARPVKDHSERIKAAVAEVVPAGVVPIVTGFIGKTAGGEITTVGRNGSDYSATVFAAALEAEECEIWTDTDGVMSADPKLVPEAKSIPVMSFAEASELAYYGGRVLHPSTLIPAIQKNIPVRVLNTNRPDHAGTVITEAGGAPIGPVTSIAYKSDQSVITISSTSMLGQPGFLARIFDVLGRAKIDIDMISTSEVTVSMTCARVPALMDAVEELKERGRVSLDHHKSLICVVGQNIKGQPGIAAKIFGALSQAQVNVEMISHGANNINLSLVVADSEVKRAIPALHGAFF